MDYGFDRTLAMSTATNEAFIIMDADNQVSPSYLKIMNQLTISVRTQPWKLKEFWFQL